MTFLNPTFLWAAFAVAIPIIVHLFNFRRPRKVLFSNIAMVKEVRKSVVRRLRLKQWLLLAARILAILALVFLFAQPVIKDDNAEGLAAGNNSVAVVIDNSYSMKAGNERGSYFLQATKLAEEIVEGYSESDDFLVMTTADLKLNYDFGGPEEAIETIRKLKIRQNLNGIEDVLRLDKEIFGETEQNKILYFISDFQESTIIPDSGLSSLQDSSITTWFIPVADRKQRNVYITGHQIETRIIQPGNPVELSLSLVNESPDPVKDLKVQLILENQTIPLGNISLKPGQKMDTSGAFVPKKKGWNSGYIEIDDYPVEYDNRRYFSFYVPDKEKVLIVEGEISTSLHLLYEELFEQFDPEFISVRDLSKARLENYRFFILAGINELSTGFQEQLRFHLSEGKSFAFFPGSEPDIANLNNFFSSIRAGSVAELRNLEDGITAPDVDMNHPVFGDVFKQGGKKGKIEAPMVYKYLPFTPNNDIEQNTIIGMANGDVLLQELRPLNGQLFLFTSFPADEWTDLHYKGIFAPLMLRLSMLMNQTREVEQTQDLGNLRVKRIKPRDQSQVRLVNESGVEIIPLQEPRSGYMVLRLDRLSKDNVVEVSEGNYDMKQGDYLLEKISFNIPDKESKLSAMQENELESWLSENGLAKIRISLPEPGSVADQIRFSKEGYPLWKYFLIAAILFLIAEILILQMKETA